GALPVGASRGVWSRWASLESCSLTLAETSVTRLETSFTWPDTVATCSSTYLCVAQPPKLAAPTNIAPAIMTPEMVRFIQPLRSDGPSPPVCHHSRGYCFRWKRA